MVQFELVFFSSTKCALDYNKKVSFLYLLPSFPFTFLGFFVCFCLSFLLLNFAFGRIKQLHFDFLRSVIYTWKRSISNQLALTNLHLSVFFSFFFQKFRGGNTGRGRGRSAVCVCVLVCLRRYIDFGRILRHVFFMPSCLNKLLASTVQRAIEVGHENLLCSLSSRIQELLFKHGANVRKNMKLELMTGKHLVQHIPKKWGRIERDVLRGFEIEIAKTQRNKELFFCF